jgi:hypothetical protein
VDACTYESIKKYRGFLLKNTLLDAVVDHLDDDNVTNAMDELSRDPFRKHHPKP